MSNSCECPDPPGGTQTCSDDQLAVCGYQNGKIVSGCFDRPQRVRLMRGTSAGRLALANWVISKITGITRPHDSDLDDGVIGMLISGRYENEQTGEVLTFSVPKDLDLPRYQTLSRR